MYRLKTQHPCLKTTHHIKTREHQNKIHSLKSPYVFKTSNLTEGSSIPSVYVFYSLRFSHTHLCYNDKTDSISFILRKTETSSLTKKSYPLSHDFMEDTMRHNIAQTTSASKVYVSCLLVIIIKWCHMKSLVPYLYFSTHIK